jgi:uncharacterized protein (TIGR02145 family)
VGHSNTTNYDGQEHGVSGFDTTFSTPLYKGTYFTFSGHDTAKRTEKGTSYMGLEANQFTNTNVNFDMVTFLVTDGYQTITAANEAIVTITGHHNRVDYDGTEHSVIGYDVQISNPLYHETDFVFSGGDTATRTNAGTTYMGLEATQFTNMNSNFVEVIFHVTDGYQTIEPINATVTITGNNNTVSYDGVEHTVSGYTAVANTSLYDVDHDFTFSGHDTAVRKNAGTSNMGLAANQFTNTNVNFDTVTFLVTDGYQTIDTNNVPIVITSGNHEFSYDGMPHSFPSYTVTYNSLPVDHTTSDSTKFELPTGDVLSVFNPASVTNSSDNIAHNNTFDYSIENAANYNSSAVSTVYGSISINSLQQTLSIASLGNSWTFDGTAHCNKHYQVYFGGTEVTAVENDTVFTLPSGDRLTITNAPSITHAGKLANTFSYTLENDIIYLGIRDTIVDTLYVNPLSGITVNIKEHGGETTYDGYEQRVSGYDMVSVSNSLYTATDFRYIGPESDTIVKGRYAGVYQMGLTAAEFENINSDFSEISFTVQDDSLVIKANPMAITITGGSAEKPYDGTPLTNNNYSYTPGVLADGDTLVVVMEGSNSGIGDSLNRVVEYAVYRDESRNNTMVHPGLRMMMAPPTGYGRDVTDCYTFNVSVSGILRVVANGNVTVNVTGHTGEYNYNHQTHHVGGYDVTITDTLGLYTMADFHFIGDSTIDESEIGTYPMNLTSAMFVNDNIYFSPVTFNVTDGWLVIQDSLFISDIIVDNITCNGSADGKADIIVFGGPHDTSPYYSYEVEGVNTSDNYTGTSDGTITLTGLRADTYQVTITDALSYTATATFVIEEPALLTATVSVQADLCPNQASYAVGMTTTGGNGGNHFSWYLNATNVDAQSTVVNRTLPNDCGHTYQAAVMVSDSKGCVARDTVIFKVEDTEAPTFNAPADTTLCRNAVGEIDASTSATGTPNQDSFSDNCSAPTQLTISYHDTDTTGTDNDRRVIHRVWRLTDKCGNYSEQTQNITIRPSINSENSVFNSPANIDTLVYGCNITLVSLGTPTFTTSTGYDLSDLIITNNAPADNIFEMGETIVTWTITDSCGFSMTSDQIINVSHHTCPDAVDFEGNHYPSIRLGRNCMCWTTVNLKSTKYSDGRDVEDVMTYYSNRYSDTTANANIFGHLYTWYAAADTALHSVEEIEALYAQNQRIQGICPAGWYLPTEMDYDDLNIYPTEDLRSTSYWLTARDNTNATGFNSLPAGMYNCQKDRFENLMGDAYYWTCHPVYDMATGAMINFVCELIVFPEVERCNGFSIRCVWEGH